MKVVVRFKLDASRQVQSIHIPHRSRYLDLKRVNGAPNLWVEIDNQFTAVEKKIYIISTGDDKPKGKLHYIGTIQNNLEMVMHFYGEV